MFRGFSLSFVFCFCLFILVRVVSCSSWTTTTAPSWGPVIESCWVSYNSKLISFGGSRTSYVATDEVYEFDPVTNTWSSLEALPDSRRGLGCAYFSGYTYIWGGIATGMRTALYYYRHSTDIWTERTTTNAPEGRYGHCMMPYSSSYAFVLFGRGVSGVLNDAYRLTVSSGLFTSLSLTGDSIQERSHAACAWNSDNSKLYVYGGLDNSDAPLDDFFELSLSGYTLTVTQLSPSEDPLARSGASLIAYDGRLLLFGGYYGEWPDEYLFSVWEYDIFLNRWREPPITGTEPDERSHMGVLVMDSNIYVIGGKDSMGQTLQWAVTDYAPPYCPVGEYSADGTESCSECAAGTYNSDTHAYSCTDCSAGTYSVGTGNTGCTDCDPGTYSTIVGLSSSSCTSCPAGTFSTASGADALSDCTACGAGYYCEGGTARSPCPAGTYRSSTGGTSLASCSSCDKGKYQPSTGQTSCLTVPAGYYQDSTGQIDYELCGLGRYCPSGSESPTLCSAGTYQASTDHATDSSYCLPVPAGYYNPSEGSSTYIECPVRTYRSSTGADDLSDCLYCDMGFHNNQTGQSECLECPMGTYQDSTGQLWCNLCPTGTTQGLTAQTSSSSCIDCPAGTYQPSLGQVSEADDCLESPQGSYSSTGSAMYTECPAGQYGTYAGAWNDSVCVDCPHNTYSASTGQASCDACTGDTFAYEGATECEDCTSLPEACQCPDGEYPRVHPVTSEDQCITCEVGFYCSAGQRLACPDGYMSLGGQSVCEPLRAGWLGQGVALPCLGTTYADTATNSCLPCPPGYRCNIGVKQPCRAGYYSTGDAYKCEPCLPNTYSSEGSSSCSACSDGGNLVSTHARDHCIACKAGEELSADGVCASCAEGYTSVAGDTLGCSACPDGSGSLTGMSFCIPGL